MHYFCKSGDLYHFCCAHSYAAHVTVEANANWPVLPRQRPGDSRLIFRARRRGRCRGRVLPPGAVRKYPGIPKCVVIYNMFGPWDPKVQMY